MTNEQHAERMRRLDEMGRRAMLSARRQKLRYYYLPIVATCVITAIAIWLVAVAVQR